MFLDIFAPILCSGCMTFGGAALGVNLGPVQPEVGWVYKQMPSGHVDKDAMLASVAIEAARSDRFSAGVFTLERFAPDGKHGRANYIGPYIEGHSIRVSAARHWAMLTWRLDL